MKRKRKEKKKFREGALNAIVIELKPESVLVVRRRKEFKKFGLASLDSLLAFIRRQFNLKFIVRPSGNKATTFKLIFSEDLMGDSVGMSNLLNNNEHVVHAE